MVIKYMLLSLHLVTLSTLYYRIAWLSVRFTRRLGPDWIAFGWTG